VTLRDEIRGAWQLIAYVVQDDQDGPATHPLGPDAQGLIVYTHDGYMSAQLMRCDRPDYDQPDTGGGTTTSWCPYCPTGWAPCSYGTVRWCFRQSQSCATSACDRIAIARNHDPERCTHSQPAAALGDLSKELGDTGLREHPFGYRRPKGPSSKHQPKGLVADDDLWFAGSQGT